MECVSCYSGTVEIQVDVIDLVSSFFFSHFGKSLLMVLQKGAVLLVPSFP